MEASVAAGESIAAVARKNSLVRNTLAYHLNGHSTYASPEREEAFKKEQKLKRQAKKLGLAVIPQGTATRTDPSDVPSSVRTAEILSDVRAFRQKLDGTDLLEDSEFSSVHNKLKGLSMVLEQLLDTQLAASASPGTLINIIEESRKILVEEAKLIELISPLRQKQSNTIVLISPFVTQLQEILTDELKEYPKLMGAIAHRLRGFVKPSEG